MTCPHCAASISETEERCPYCDSYIDRGRHPRVEPPPPQQNRNLVRSLGEDKVNPLLVALSLIPMLGIILGAIFMSGGNPKSGKTYLITGLVAFAVAFACPFISVMATMIFSAIHA